MILGMIQFLQIKKAKIMKSKKLILVCSAVLLGTGLTAASSDIGYIKIIHMIGFLGLYFVLYLYLATIKLIKTFKKIQFGLF